MKKLLSLILGLVATAGCSDEGVVIETGTFGHRDRVWELYEEPKAEITYVDDEGYILYEMGSGAREEFLPPNNATLGAFRGDNGLFIPCKTTTTTVNYAKHLGNFNAAAFLSLEWNVNYNPSNDMWSKYHINLTDAWTGSFKCGDSILGGLPVNGRYDARMTYGTVGGAADAFVSTVVFTTGTTIKNADVKVDSAKIRAWACSKGLIPSCVVVPTQGPALNTAFNIEKYAWAKGFARAMGWVTESSNACPAVGTDHLVHNVVPTAANCWTDPDSEGSYYSTTSPHPAGGDPFFSDGTGVSLAGEL